MIKKIIILALLASVFVPQISFFSQKIAKAEYYWDSDPGFGNGISLIALDGNFNEAIETVIKTTASVPSNGGVHQFNIRFQDSTGVWGGSFKRAIHIEEFASQNLVISSAEYFWDSDPGLGSGIGLLVFDGQFDQAIETVLNNNVNLPTTSGLHLFHIRVRDQNNNWSPTYKRTIYLDDPSVQNMKVSSAEYFWDTDPGQGSGTSLIAFDGNYDEAIESVFNSNPIIPNSGVHSFNIRIKNPDNSWGPVYRRTVYLSDNSVQNIQVSGGEYFWDTDPGVGSGIPLLAFDGAFDEAIESLLHGGISIPGSGLHLFNIRVKNPDNSWSPTFKRTVYVGENQVQNIQIVQAEYYWGFSDPGPGNGTTILAIDGTLDSEIEEVFDNNAYIPMQGILLFNLRFKNGQGIWGPSYKRAINCLASNFLHLSSNAQGDSICPGDSVRLIAQGGIQQTWLINGVQMNQDTIWVHPDSSMTYLAFAMNEFGFVDTSSIFIYVIYPQTLFNLIDTFYCLNSTSVNLTGYPAGGMFSGPGVVNNYFYPDSAGIGMHFLYYEATDQYGCTAVDSLLTRVDNLPSFDTLSITACDSFSINGATYYSSGIFSQQFTNYLGCDSTLTIDLSINNSNSSIITETACNYYISPSGQTRYTSGLYSDTVLNMSGCDSIININLTVYYNDTTFVVDTVCNAYIASDGQVFTNNGLYEIVESTIHGCDSVIVLDLVINNNSEIFIADTVCSEFVLNGVSYYSSGEYIQTLTNSAGCDSIINLSLIVSNETHSETFVYACESYVSPAGNLYLNSGIYIDTIPNFAGCDSIITTNLFLGHAETAFVSISECNNYTLPNGLILSESGNYVVNLSNIYGCDSVLIINLEILNTSSFLTEAVCDSYQAPDGTVLTNSGNYEISIPNSNGCDSIIYVALTVHPSDTLYENVFECQSYVAPDGQMVTNSQIYTSHFLNQFGCDSLIISDVIIGNSFSTISAQACDYYYSMDGVVYETSGNYVAILTNELGCDSVINIELTILNSDTISLVENACDVYLAPNGQVITSSGLYSFNLTNSFGCDSIISIDLTLNQNTSSTLFASALNSYTLNSTTYYESGIYQQSLMNDAGCDSTITLDLTIEHTGLNYVQNSNGLKIFPNPSIDGVFMIASEGDFEIIDLSDVYGKKVPVEVIGHKISLKEIGRGVYVISVRHNDSLIKIKLFYV